MANDAAAKPAEVPSLVDTVLALVPDPTIVVGADGVIAAVSDQVHALFGYEPGELVGRPVEELVPERFRHQHRHDRAAFAAAPRRRSMGVSSDLVGRRRDGTEIPLDISLAPLAVEGRTLVVAAVRDITGRRAAEAAQAQLAAIVRSSLDAILATTADGRILSWNPAAERALGFSADEVIGTHVSRLVPPDASCWFEEQLDRARRNEPVAPVDTEWLTRAGGRVPVSVSVSPMDIAGGPPGFSVLLHDITEAKRVEAELRRLLQASERQARWQEASAEIRLAALAGDPLGRVLRLIADRTLGLMGASGVAIVRSPDELVATAGTASEPAVASLALGGLVDGDGVRALPAGELPPALRRALHNPRVLVASVPGDNPPGVALVCDVPSGPAGGDFDTERILASLAEHAALAIGLEGARGDRERLLLVHERERIARDLHDHVVQSLFATGLGLQSVLPLAGNEQVAERVDEAVDALDATIRQIRTTIFTLSAPPSGEGLRASLMSVAAEAARGLGFEPSMSFDGPVDSVVASAIADQVVAVVREALANIARHARATRAGVEVQVSAAQCRVRVFDDGVGFEAPSSGNGLHNLRARAEELGGELEVASASGRGTRLEWSVPL